ncbi:metallophosphoesterase family protein [Adhaeribacter aquaticus]|uniref:metallophosphoesterase family protein n=1 Tax=Adhaeribacter aquaticus TaxID=299567 RepID=UPI0003F61BA5|nr:metallophosphoesterase [Adhaeribacter aquaticus]
MLYNTLLILFILICLGLVIAYFRESKHRRQPYFKFPAEAQPASLSNLAKPIHSVALIGDPGNITDSENDPIMKLLRRWMTFAGEAGTIIILGDNIYPKGLPAKDDYKRANAELKINAQLQVLNEHKGRTIYLSGNHDWNRGRKNGFSYLMRQQDYITNYLQDAESYLPLNGCPGPVSVELTPGLQLIIINTQWWVQRGLRPIGKQYGCTVDTEEDFFKELKALLDANKEKQVLIAAHHPLYSNAQHGGKFNLKQHVFPLTAANKRFLIPLPVAGSIYPMYRKYIGAYEDMSHPRYRHMRRQLLTLLHQYNNLIYAAGHDHNLQYFPVKGNHYLVSGSASKTTFVKKGGKAAFTHEHRGFFTIDFYEKEVWLRALEPNLLLENHPEVVYQRKLV